MLSVFGQSGDDSGCYSSPLCASVWLRQYSTLYVISFYKSSILQIIGLSFAVHPQVNDLKVYYVGEIDMPFPFGGCVTSVALPDDVLLR